MFFKWLANGHVQWMLAIAIAAAALRSIKSRTYLTLKATVC